MTIQEKMKPGCQRTDVGVIPQDWAVSTLKQLVDVDRGIRYGIVQPGRFVLSGRLLIRGQDYSKGWVDASEMFRVGHEIEARYKNARVRRGDLIITIVGAGTGHVEEIPAWLDGANLTQTTARVAIDERKAAPQFVKYVLIGAAGEANVANYVKGGAQPGLNCGDVDRFLIPHPLNLNEQRAIAAALSDADALIASLDALIAKKRDLKQAAMQQLLTGKTRLPGFEIEGGYKETEIGEIPKDWDLARIVDIASITTGSRNTQDRIDDGAFPFFVRSQTVECINSYSFDGEAVLTAGDGVGTGKIFHYINGKFDFHQRVYKISGFSDRLVGYFFYIYFSNKFYDRIMAMTAKSSVDSVRREMIANMLVPLPAASEQRAIAAVLSDMESELTVVEAKRDKARAIKQGMMQELLTGRIRLI